MATKTVPIRGAIIEWARNEAGLQIDDLARQLKVDPQTVLDWEQDDLDPTRGEFTKLQNVLKRPSALFFMTEPPVQSGLPLAFRSAPGLGSHDLGPAEAKQIRWARRLQEITSWVLQDDAAPISPLPVIRTDTDPGVEGARLRVELGPSVEDQLAWKSPSEAFKALREMLESLGILVLQLSMGKDNIRGFGSWDEFAPLVAVNTSYHPTARVFTLLHEVGHLLTRTDSACQDFVGPGKGSLTNERWCEVFAANFLIPGKALREVAEAKYGVTNRNKVDDPDKARLIAQRFSVSTRAMAIRLQETGLAESTLYASVAAVLAARDWNSSGGGGGGGQPAAEKRLGQLGARLPSILLGGAYRERMNRRDLADYLDLTTTQVDELQGLLRES